MRSFSSPPRGFAVGEYETRTKHAQDLMAQHGLSGLLLTTEPEVRYFSGFQTLFWQSPTRPWFLFVPSQGKPIAIIPEIGAALMQKTWIDDVRTWSAPNPSDDGLSLLKDLLSPLVNNKKRIGVMKGHETHLRMPLGDYERLLVMLNGIDIVDCTAILRSLRMVKSTAEIEKLSHICKIASDTFSNIPNIIHEGQPFEDSFRAFRTEALAQGADDVPYLVGGADQGGYFDVISPPSKRQLRSGDIAMFDTGSVWDGYYCDFDRNFAIGSADDASKHAYDVLWRATEAGIAAAKPGNTCRDLFLSMQSVIAELDDQGGDVGRLGHGLGMQLTEWPSHASFDETVIEENMVLTLEPSLGYGESKIMVHEENIVVRSNGAELLSQRAASELPIIKG